MPSTITSPYSPHPQEAQFGMRVAGLLSLGTQTVPADIGERLRFAREQALAGARQQRAATTPSVVHAGGANLALSGPPVWWWRVLAVLPLLLLVGGLGLVHQASQREQMLAVADVDTVLLADRLPPRAYSDPGFAEYLRSDPP